MSVTLYDDTAWSVEAPDPEVGLFGYVWTHEACTKELEMGAEYEEHLHGEEDARGYVANTVTVTCLDCGASTSFEDAEFVGSRFGESSDEY